MTKSTAAEKYTKDWPVIWRIVAPGAGSYNRDMVFVETDCRKTAINRFRACRRSGYPVRMEEVRCGPLPEDYAAELAELRGYNNQNPGTSLRDIPAAWVKKTSPARVGGAS